MQGYQEIRRRTCGRISSRNRAWLAFRYPGEMPPRRDLSQRKRRATEITEKTERFYLTKRDKENRDEGRKAPELSGASKKRKP